MRNRGIATMNSFEARSAESPCVPAQRVESVCSIALFDWGMGLGAALFRGHASGHGPAAPRCLDRDPKGRPPTS